MNWRWWTAAVVMFAVTFVAAYDAAAYFVGGMDVTVSQLVVGWLALSSNPLPPFMAGVVLGGWMVHFCGWMVFPKRKARG